MFFVLLFTQVLIVSSLALTGLWLYFKRLKNSTSDEQVPNEGSAELLAAANTAKETYLEIIKNLEVKVTSLEVEANELRATDAMQQLNVEKGKTAELQKINDEVRGKIQELELKLLEYEVLRDEIGQISGIKAENIKLKEEASLLNEKLANLKNSNPSAQVETVPTKAEESVPPKLVEAQAPFVSDMSEVPSSQVEQKNNSVVALDTSAVQDDAGLEGLLSEIEALTSEKNELQRKKA